MNNQSNEPICDPQIWGGIECTINRTESGYFDQLALSGHYKRWETDLDKIASLGIKALRYPILWERHEPIKGELIDWSFTEPSLAKIKEQGIVPIAGLLHHGSGPSYTDLLDEKFPQQLAAYAGQVAQKFPWIEYYTPVNEPLTTARFSGLYGLWYPHHKKDTSFVKMFINEMKAVVLCMEEIRKINPAAKLIQTEDLSKTYSTEVLSFQATFENERRWLTFDLLCGKVKPGTMMYSYLERLGVPTTDIRFFEEHPCPPHIMGMNYYITSERYLDDNLANYPAHTHGGNELQQYADVEAVRVDHPHAWGLKVLMKEAWDRFHLPLAVTECHLHCSREEQIRWFEHCWTTVKELKQEGIDVRALTVWSLLGAFGWDKLLTSAKMNYESGVFDTRTGKARETALGNIVRSAASGEPHDHPLCNVPGWWERHKASYEPQDFLPAGDAAEKPLLIIGKNGTLARAFSRICEQRNIPVLCAGREEANITDYQSLKHLIESVKPWAVINTAGYVDIDGAENEEDHCVALNTSAPVLMASICKKHDIMFMTFSSDQVFGGGTHTSCYERDETNPLNVYGKSKALKEYLVQAVNPKACIVRSSAFFGPWDEANFAWAVISQLEKGETFSAAADIYISPTYVPDLVDASLNILIDRQSGIFHIANKGSSSWATFAKLIAKMAGLDPRLVRAVPAAEMGWLAARPVHACLASERGIELPMLPDAVQRYLFELKKETVEVGA